MKKLVLSFLAVPLLLPTPATGQNHNSKESSAFLWSPISGLRAL